MLNTDTFRRLAKSMAARLVITGYDEFCPKQRIGRALVSYLAYPLLPPPRWRDKRLFSNRGLAQEIPRALNELGFVVDVVGCYNPRWRPRRDYDIFIGHAATNFTSIAECLPCSTSKIYFSAGLYWKELNLREARRLYEFADRTGYLLPPDRAVTESEERANEMADGIIHLGNAAVGRTYSKFDNVAGVNNAAFPVTWNGMHRKDFSAGRKHFLFFNGRGNIHKGLDRVLEAFARLAPDLHLHVCQHIEPGFGAIYASELYGTPNIHVCGFVKQRSKRFYELMSLCNWVISATCAEGQPGSIIETMAHGLIPIVPNAVNMHLGAWALPLPDCDVDTIGRVVRDASFLNTSQCRTMAEGAAREVKEHYTPENFREGFKRAVSAFKQIREPHAEVAVGPQAHLL